MTHPVSFKKRKDVGPLEPIAFSKLMQIDGKNRTIQVNLTEKEAKRIASEYWVRESELEATRRILDFVSLHDEIPKYAVTAINSPETIKQVASSARARMELPDVPRSKAWNDALRHVVLQRSRDVCMKKIQRYVKVYGMEDEMARFVFVDDLRYAGFHGLLKDKSQALTLIEARLLRIPNEEFFGFYHNLVQLLANPIVDETDYVTKDGDCHA